MYKDLSVQNADFFQNILYGRAFLRRRQEHTLISPGEETRWLPNLLESEVTYSPSANKVIIPEYLLAEPLFHPKYPVNVILGGLGSMVAEAIVDGVAGKGGVFTATGRILDGSDTGNFALNRVDKPNTALQDSARCIVSKWFQLGVDTRDQLHKTATSNAISVAGLQAAFAALSEIYLSQTAELLPSLEDVDPQAVFFMKYSQLHCSLATKQQEDMDRTLKVQLFGKEKVEGVLASIAEFRHYLMCEEMDEATHCDTFF